MLICSARYAALGSAGKIVAEIIHSFEDKLPHHQAW